MNRFRLWHKLKGHKFKVSIGDRPDEFLVFADCINCPRDPGWLIKSIRKFK